MTLMDAAHDFAIISVLLAVGYFLRMKIKLFQQLFLPASIIGGLVGLICGPQILGLHSPVYITYTPSIDQWPGVLLAVTFACSFLGEPMEKVTKQAVAATLVGGVAHQAQAVLGMLVAFLFRAAIPVGFGLLPLFSLYGGLGWAVPVANIFSEQGHWADGVPVAIAISTMGVVCGIIFGIIIVNIGIRKGLVIHTYASLDDLSEEVRTGYIPIGQRHPIGHAVSKSSSLDPFALQLAIVGVVVGCAVLLRKVLISLAPFWNNLPLQSAALICSGIFGVIIGRSKYLHEHIDRDTIERISNVSLEYVITAAVATTSISTFITYLVPILVIAVVTIAATTWISLFFSKRWLPKDWFACAVAQYGAYMGLLSTGLLLAKVVDPDRKTTAAETVAASCTFGYSYSLPYLLIMPLVVMSNPNLVLIISAVLLLVFLVLGELFFRPSRRKEPNI